MLGTRVDAALSNNVLIRSRRAAIGLAGNSGIVPANYERLLGEAKLADDPEKRVQIKFDTATQKLDIRQLYHGAEVLLDDGTKAFRFVVDERDKDQIPTILQRERRRRGLPPLSNEQLTAEVETCVEEVITIKNPRVLMARSFDFSYVRHAMIKIAYELAFLWLGESYLDDPEADALRTAICKPDPASTDHLAAYVGDTENCTPFEMWTEDKTRHLAYAFAGNEGIAIAVRVFDIYAAFVWVTKDAARYLERQDERQKLRFLAIDPTSKK